MKNRKIDDTPLARNVLNELGIDYLIDLTKYKLIVRLSNSDLSILKELIKPVEY